MTTPHPDSIQSRAEAHCVVCGAAGKTIYRDLVDRLFGAPGTWDISQCDNDKCRLLWLNPQPLASEIGKAYRHYYTHPGNRAARGLGRHLLAATRRMLLGALLLFTGLAREAAAVSSMHLAGRRPGRLLEIGCGDGAFLRRMAARGWRVEGLDPDPAAAALATDRHGIPVHVGQLTQMRLPESTYDAIALNHSIEHVHDPVELLRECRRLLKPGGIVVCVTPNADSWGRTRHGTNWRGLEPPRHIHIFTLDALAKLAELAGFAKRRLYSTTVNHWIIDGASRTLAAAAPGSRHVTGATGPAKILAAIATQAWLALRNRRHGNIGEECVLVAERAAPLTSMPSTAARVCAVIVVFHPDWAQLRCQLATLRRQVDIAVFVDNSGDSQVQRQLAQIAEEYAVDSITPGTNLGIAAAHNLGIEHARRKQATHVLLMDQDSIPAEHMVMRLLDAGLSLARQGKAVAAVGPVIVGALPAAGVADAGCKAADMLISSGTLISLAALDRVGTMDESLFIDQVDTEWCLRAGAMNLACYAVGDAQMTHRLGSAQIGLRLWRQYRIPLHSPVRHYFNFRNSILMYRRDYVAGSWMIRDWLRLIKLLVYFGLMAKNRRRHLAMMLRGVIDGWRGVTGNPFASDPAAARQKAGA